MNWKHIIADLRDWYGKKVWKAAFARMPDLRLNRTEMRVFLLCILTNEGPRALERYDVREILAMRDICGRRWFDWQLMASDEGHEVTDPFRTIQ